MKKRNLIAVLMSVVLAATTTVDMPTFAAADQPQEITEQEAVAYLCAELGIDDWDAYIADLAARYHADENNGGTRDTCPFDPDYFIDIYTGGSSNGQVDSLDAMYLLNFLNGQVNYPYVYTDLDPTQDCIVDRADVQALMDCFTMVILLEEYPDFVPGTHGASRTTENTFENRTYRVYNCSTQTEGTPYTLSLSDLNGMNGLITEQSHDLDRSFTITPDTRFVRVFSNGGMGTGFIVDTHIIATAAHVVFSRSTNSFTFSSVKALSFNGNPMTSNETPLNAVSVHIPSQYYTCSNDEVQNYDYALIYVSDTLTNKFELSIPIEGLCNTTITKSMGLVPKQYMVDEYDNPYTGSWVYPCYAYGTFNTFGYGNANYPDHVFTTTCEYHNGQSGGCCVVETEWQNNEYQSVIGIHYGSIGSSSLEVRLTRPLLQFYLNNDEL